MEVDKSMATAGRREQGEALSFASQPLDLAVRVGPGAVPTVEDYELLAEVRGDDVEPSLPPEVRVARARDSTQLLEYMVVEARSGYGELFGIVIGERDRSQEAGWSLTGGVTDRQRQRGVGRALLEAARNAAGSSGCTCTTSDPRAEEFIRAAGGTPYARRLMQAARRRDLPIASSRVLGCQLVLWDCPTPEPLLEPTARLMSLIYGDVDPGDLRRQEARTVRFGIDEFTVAATAEDSGALVGYTDVAWDPFLPTIARIGGSAVVSSWRGRGLARWLKIEAMNIAFQRWRVVERLITDNAEENEPIRRLNESLGFAPTRILQDWRL